MAYMFHNLALAVCLIASSCTHVSSQTPVSKGLREQLEAYTAINPGRVGVLVKLLETGESVGVREDEKFPMQSVYKFPIGMAVLRRVDEGRLKLDERVAVVEADYVLPNQHSPIRDKHPKGVTLTVSELLRYMVSESDGSACDVLLRLIGGPASVRAYLDDLGVTGLNVMNTEKEIGRKNSVQYDNWAKPAAAVALLQKLHEGKALSGSSRKLLLHLMTETPTGANRIKGLLPRGTMLAHKTGSSGAVDGIAAATNDVGIVILPDGRHLAVAVFVSDAAADTQARERVIANIARAAWDHWAK